MRENVLTEIALEIAERQGYAAAYSFLLENAGAVEDCPSLYYFLGCLASGAGRAPEGLGWLRKAVDELGFWYRPEMLSDEDLTPLFEDAEFLRIAELSRARWAQALRQARPMCTWQKKSAEVLLVALHGNGQNAAIALEDWRDARAAGFQVEAVQSRIPDSYGRFRWADDEMTEFLSNTSARVAAQGYNRVCWAGFSAGCDALLRAVAFGGLHCDALLLQSPWTPVMERDAQGVARALREKGVRVYIFCGDQDADCGEMARALDAAARAAGAQSALTWLPGLRHQFPVPLTGAYFDALSR